LRADNSAPTIARADNCGRDNSAPAIARKNTAYLEEERQ